MMDRSAAALWSRCLGLLRVARPSFMDVSRKRKTHKSRRQKGNKPLLEVFLILCLAPTTIRGGEMELNVLMRILVGEVCCSHNDLCSRSLWYILMTSVSN
ncbi:hypothetical protein CDAR_437781 [Caerostris darwini]|uniref:Secreted protein n=1 Tax=Caerostris darwini TaxID=1538125 RepID=A0AAV4NSJ5_9ARAC|nr:hypothetical protein CDAR_437781 [Caerostris darwini]